jgi:hypothetical protein
MGDNPVRTRDAYECVAAFWSHWRQAFIEMHDANYIHPDMKTVIDNIELDGSENKDLLKVQTWINTSDVHDWKVNHNFDEYEDSDDTDVNE